MKNYFVSIGQSTNPACNELTEHSTITEIIGHFQEHSSITKIKSNLKNNATLNFQPITKGGLRHIIVANGHDMINAKFLKDSVDVILQLLLNIINKCILQGHFPKSLKKAIVSPIYKKNAPFNKENNRHISLLKAFSKVLKK